MPFLPLPKEVEKEAVTVQLDVSVVAQLDRYRDYLGRDSTRRIDRSYVIAEALRVVFRRDREFARFLREPQNPSHSLAERESRPAGTNPDPRQEPVADSDSDRRALRRTGSQTRATTFTEPQD